MRRETEVEMNDRGEVVNHRDFAGNEEPLTLIPFHIACTILCRCEIRGAMPLSQSRLDESSRKCYQITE